MNPIPLVDLQAQYRTISNEIDAAIAAVLASGQFILGGEVRDFEAEFAAFVGTRFAVGVSSGLDALRLTVRALRVGRGAEVILPANTFIATALAVSDAGARPVLVDCDPVTYCLDPKLVEAAVTSRTRMIIPVHLAGCPAEMEPLLQAATRHELLIVEDAAQAHGAAYRGRACGGIGAAGCFSFYPGKNLGAYGDGGLVTTSDELLAGRLRSLREYGQRNKYEHVEQGLNARLDALQAAILRVKLRRLSAWNQARAAHAAYYRTLLAGVGDLAFQQQPSGAVHVYHLFIVQTSYRDQLRRHLADAGIRTGIHYPIPLHLQEAYRELGYARGAFPVSERLAQTTLSLPLFPELSEEQLERIVAEVRRFFASTATIAAGAGQASRPTETATAAASAAGSGEGRLPVTAVSPVLSGQPNLGGAG